MYISDTHLKSFLADAGLVSQKDFDVAEREAKESGKVLPRLTDVASIKFALKQYQQGLKDNLGDVIKRETEALAKSGTVKEKEEDLRQMAEGVSAVRIIDTLLRHANAQGASDIHIEPLEDTLLIRYL